MVENGTLIEKIEKHPRIWCTVAAIITLICIAGGVFLFAVRPCFKASKIEKAPYFGHVKCEITEHYADEDFEIRNSFCRYIPTGNDYFYRICTEDGAWIIVRGDKNEDLSVGKKIEGRVRKFNKEEMKYLADTYAQNDVCYVDLTWKRLAVWQIISGLLMALAIFLGASMIKDKISAESKMRNAAEIVFCALPFPFAAIWIYLLCHL